MPRTHVGTVDPTGSHEPVESSGHSIRAVRTTPINIPLVAPYRWSVGLFAGFSKTVVEVETDQGAVGIGEAPTEASKPIIDGYLAPRLVGADPVDLAACEGRCLPPIHALANTEDASILRAWGGVEMALWDLAGKIANRSVAGLLGGRVRDRMQVSEYFAFRVANNGVQGESTPLEVARYCAKMVELHRSPCLEGKVGILDIATELATVREIRNAVGDDITLRLDANMAWTTTEARYALRALEKYGVQSVEEPTRTLDELARLRSSTSIAFSCHEPNLRAAVRLGVPDSFVINLTALGGIRRTVAFIAACQELGIGVWFYSPDSGIANAAYLQLAASVQWLSQPSQTLLRWHADEVIAEGPLVPEAGLLAVPTGAGLGVTLDEEALKRCHQRFLQDGPYQTYALRPSR